MAIKFRSGSDELQWTPAQLKELRSLDAKPFEIPRIPTKTDKQRAYTKFISDALEMVANDTPNVPRRKGGRKSDPNSKKLLTLRLDPQVIEHFRATGEGWQTRMNDALRKAAGL